VLIVIKRTSENTHSRHLGEYEQDKGRAPKEPGPRLTSHYPRIARWTLVTRLLVPSAGLKTSSVVNSVHRRFTRFRMVMTSGTAGAGPFRGAAFWLMSFLLSVRRSFVSTVTLVAPLSWEEGDGFLTCSGKFSREICPRKLSREIEASAYAQRAPVGTHCVAKGLTRVGVERSGAWGAPARSSVR
jgi:hypothetical protein